MYICIYTCVHVNRWVNTFIKVLHESAKLLYGRPSVMKFIYGNKHIHIHINIYIHIYIYIYIYIYISTGVIWVSQATTRQTFGHEGKSLWQYIHTLQTRIWMGLRMGLNPYYTDIRFYGFMGVRNLSVMKGSHYDNILIHYKPVYGWDYKFV
jgi:hypothetical protein